MIRKPNDIEYLGFGFYKDNLTQSYKVITYEIFGCKTKRETETTCIKKLVSLDYCLLMIKTVNYRKINYW